MDNIEIVILSVVVMIAFLVFIITSIKEFSKMEKEEYTYNPTRKKFGRDAVYDMMERLFDDTKQTKEEKDPTTRERLDQGEGEREGWVGE